MDDCLIFAPDDVDLARSPLRRSLSEPTYCLGAFNPGLTRLPSGNLLLMVRVAEALAQPVVDGHARSIRWTVDGYVLDRYSLDTIDMSDPRQFERRQRPGSATRELALTSLSWLLPVELDADGHNVIGVHYDRAIEPAASYQQYGIEDARIAHVDGRWYMTTCSVSAERLCSTLYTSDDALGWRLEGIVLDHQNKDMILFEGKVGGAFHALTRPMGEVYFAYPDEERWIGGPSIQLARSPDALHWKPLDRPGLRPHKGGRTLKLGGGTPPVLTERGWLMLYHGVEVHEGGVGTYRTFQAILDRDDPTIVVEAPPEPVLEANPALTAAVAHQLYLPSPVVFSTGIADAGNRWIVASGEADLACRITHIPKDRLG